MDKEKRSKLFIRMGIVLIIGFLVLRGINLYGDPNPWSVQKNYLFTILSFINCEKYPPSLCFLLMTVGSGILALGLLEKKIPKTIEFVMVFGRKPLLFYTLHMMMIGVFIALNVVLVWILKGYMPQDFLKHDLPVVYFGWLFIVVPLYPLFRSKILRDKVIQ